MRSLAFLIVLLAACGQAGSPPPAAPTALTDPGETVITDRSQPAAAVGKTVTIIGPQTRTKQPTVHGVDVDGDYALSDRTVIVRGVLRETVVTEVDPTVAGRGPGTYYAVVDPATGELARTALHEE
ncbi:hypothetical protein OV090_41130 [Nannocystis sp. RBIL2]|uniref:hypothetical protein n=1 Tax=Nannocystis sp. RBIL2 TaxID=2996788 RepID=UPI00227098C7|nr:hypothetical protein [Nannocystis sp. RBIL2]MCY1071218.1 hypothetical protein [Nannocystis sp. RBIL2]